MPLSGIKCKCVTFSRIRDKVFYLRVARSCFFFSFSSLHYCSCCVRTFILLLVYHCYSIALPLMAVNVPESGTYVRDILA